MANINIFALGGQDENGKDLYVLEVDNDIFVINTGIKFPINDRWGVDGIIADTTYLSERKDRIKGVFITHAHDESFAAMPWFLMDFKGTNIYSSEFTKKVIEERVSKYKINHTDYKFNVLKEQKFNNVTVKAHEIASSIPGAIALEFVTEDGSIHFMSEMTIDSLEEFGTTNLDEFKSEKNLALIVDSRRANYSGKSSEKKSIINLVEGQFQKEGKGRIIVGAYDEEMYTIKEFISLANKYNRPVAFYGSAYDSLFKKIKEVYKDVVAPKKLISYREVNNFDDAMILVTGTWSRLYQRFMRVATNNDVYLKLKTSDRIIMVCPPRNGMEVEYAVALDEITKKAPNITSITDKDFYPLRQTKDDIKEIVAAVKPKFFIPISSLFRYQAEANKAAVSSGVAKQNALMMTNGKVIYLKDGELASQKGKVKKFGDVIIQGFGVGDISYEVLRERKTLASGGLVSVSVQINRKTKQLVGKINTQIVGLIVKQQLAKFQELVNSIVIQKFEEAPKFDYREIQNSIRKRVQKQIRKFIDKEPLVVITFYEV